MKEIKFRALWKIDNKMHYWDMNHCQSGWVEPDQEISETTQYTWLKDKNWKEIYEGDISENWWAILFYQWMFAPYYDYGRQERYEDIWTNWWKDCEIIGNIYENPELIID